MIALLPVDAYIRISFSCPGPLNLDTLPPWITVRTKHPQIARSGDYPIYRVEGGASPSGLLKIITQNNSRYLQRVFVREKRSPEYGVYSVLNFAFADKPRLRACEAAAIEVLEHMLSKTWKQAKIYHTRYEQDSQAISISLSDTLEISPSARFSESDAWGIRRLVQEEE